MRRVLYISASPREGKSYSAAVAGQFLESYQALHPEDKLDVIDVFRQELLPFDGLALSAKYTILHGKEHSSEELTAWRKVEAQIAKFKAADKFVFAIPMWNFGIPYRLKQYFDIIVQPGYTFSYTEAEGYKGLITDRPAMVVYSRGGAYEEGTPAEAMDFQKKYIETVLGFIGITDIRSIVVEPTLMAGPEVAASKREDAMRRARELAATF